MLSSVESSIKVFLRFRPQNSREVKEGGRVVVNIEPDKMSLQMENNPGTFTFDHVFDWESDQITVFKNSAGPIVDEVMKGYNGTIFAYGQTGSGKTYSMVNYFFIFILLMGALEHPDLKGITPRLVESIFQTIFDAPPNVEFTVKISFLEIYMEKIRDLLNPANDNLPIHEDKIRGVYVRGLLEVFVGGVDEVYDVMRQGQSARVVASTDMNAESSRSHSIFVITVTQKNLVDGTVRTGKLSLVDLAGSEKVGKTGATGQTLEEAKKINKSLTALGMVINALTDGKSSHVPYRDSKLTRILQESLGGNSRTSLIINASPSSFNEAETVSTLRFGVRAKAIKCSAKMNVDLSPGELKNLLKKAKNEISILQAHILGLESEIKAWRSGESIPEEDRINLNSRPVSSIPIEPIAFIEPISSNLLELRNSNDESREDILDKEADFLNRENELNDQIAEKELALQKQMDIVSNLMEELGFYQKQHADIIQINGDLTSTVNDSSLQLEKATFENKEYVITIDSLKEANNDLKVQLKSLKNQLINIQSNEQEKENESELINQKIRHEKIESMIGSISREYNEKEKAIKDTLIRIESLCSNAVIPTTPEKIEELHYDWISIKHKLAHQETTNEELMSKLSELGQENTTLSRKKDEMEHKLAILEIEYEELIDNTISENHDMESMDLVEDLKEKLEQQHQTRKESFDQQLADINLELIQKEKQIEEIKENLRIIQTENTDLKLLVDTFKSGNHSKIMLDDSEIGNMKQIMAKQLEEFDSMKKKLMKDLQDRCCKVVELEISLDESREKYNTIANNTNTQSQQQKLAFLERNLEQLTNVQKQLVEQNTILKKESTLSERKLSTRNERIETLETMLQETQNRHEMQAKKYEQQIVSLREQLQESKSKQTDQNWFYSSGKIAKPLRGGGGHSGVIEENEAPCTPNLSKRSSWYISLLKK